MTRKAWMTDPQKEWLEARLPAFREAQHQRTLMKTFVSVTFNTWKEAWPIEPPTEEEVTEDGSVEKAIAVKAKTQESVCRL